MILTILFNDVVSKGKKKYPFQWKSYYDFVYLRVINTIVHMFTTNYSSPSVSFFEMDAEKVLCASEDPVYGGSQEPGSGSDWDDDFIF